MARRLHKPLEQFVALVSALPRVRACVRFVDDDEFRAGAQEFVTTLVTLDVVKADYGVLVRGEDARSLGQIAFEAVGAGSSDRHRAKVESCLKLTEPLIH